MICLSSVLSRLSSKSTALLEMQRLWLRYLFSTNWLEPRQFRDATMGILTEILWDHRLSFASQNDFGQNERFLETHQSVQAPGNLK